MFVTPEHYDYVYETPDKLNAVLPQPHKHILCLVGCWRGAITKFVENLKIIYDHIHTMAMDTDIVVVNNSYIDRVIFV